MDATTSRLVDFAQRASFADLPADTVHECKRRLVDTFACALGAYDDTVSRMARRVAGRYPAAAGALASTVWGSASPVAPEAAAFANGVMLRVLDISDMYRVKSGGHPSDVMAGILAVGEAVRADGRALIAAITLAYDVYCGFCDAYDFNSQGWDQPLYGIVASVLGVAKLLGLDRDQMGNAVSLALVPNMTLNETRHGELSAWKGCAAANASRNAVFAVLLARDGFTGPPAAIEGKHGLWSIVGRFDLDLAFDAARPHRITQTDIKSFPVCYHAQSAIWAALELRARLRPDAIDSIDIETYEFAAGFLAGDATKWAPKTRETADHSMPYIAAAALLDGEITPRSFADERLADPRLGNLMRKVKVRESSDLSTRYPEESSVRIRVRDRAGVEAVAEVNHPKGHRKNPMTDADLETKFRSMFRDYGGDAQASAVLDRLWNIDREPDLSGLLRLLVPALSTDNRQG